MRLNRRVPVGMHGGVRGRLPGTGASYSIAPGMGNNLVVKVHYALGSRKR